MTQAALSDVGDRFVCTTHTVAVDPLANLRCKLVALYCFVFGVVAFWATNVWTRLGSGSYSRSCMNYFKDDFMQSDKTIDKRIGEKNS